MRFIVCVGVLSLFLTCIGEAKIDPETAVAIWLFDKEKADTITDLSGKGNDGVVRNFPEWIDGVFGKAVKFANSGQLIEVPLSDSLNFGKDKSFTVVVWFNFTSSPNWSRIVRDRNPSPWGSGNAGWELQTQGVKIHWSLDDKAGNHVKTTYENAGTGEWRHTAMVVDRAEKKMTSYLDGENEKSVNIENIGSVTVVPTVIIGGGIVGAVDEVGIFNVPLSADEVKEIMNRGLHEVLLGAAVSPRSKLATTWGQIKSE